MIIQGKAAIYAQGVQVVQVAPSIFLGVAINLNGLFVVFELGDVYILLIVPTAKFEFSLQQVGLRFIT